MIYNEIEKEDQVDEDSEFIVDTNRYEVNPLKL